MAARRVLVGYYKKGSLSKVFHQISDAADYFNVGYHALRNSLDLKDKDVAFLVKGEEVKRIHANTYYSFITKKFTNYIKYLKSGRKLKFGCNICLKKNKLTLPYNNHFKQYGECSYCNFNNDVSVGSINAWLRRSGYLLETKSEKLLKKQLPEPVFKKPKVKPKLKRKLRKNKKPEIKVKLRSKKTPEAQKDLEVLTDHYEVNSSSERSSSSNTIRKKKVRNATYYARKTMYTVIFLTVLYWFYRGYIEEQNTIKEASKIKTARAIILDKKSDNSNDIIIYKNTEGNVFKIKNALPMWGSAEVGDSVIVHFNYKRSRLIFHKIEKITKLNN